MATLYFLQAGAEGPIKIGCTGGNICHRIQQLQAASPCELVWIGACLGSLQDEAAAHKLLAAHEFRGEWFHPTPDVLAFVRATVGADFSPEKYLDRVCFRRDRETIKAALRTSGRTWGDLQELAGLGHYAVLRWKLYLAPPNPAHVEKLLAALPLLGRATPRARRRDPHPAPAPELARTGS